MVRKCIYCHSKCGQDPNRSFHRFPREPRWRNLWLSALSGQDWIITNHTLVCSDHFGEDEFLVKPSGLRYLKKTAVPTIPHVSKSRPEIIYLPGLEDLSADVKENIIPEIVNISPEFATGSPQIVNVCVKSETESSPLILTLSEISEKNLSKYTNTDGNGHSSSSSTNSLSAPELMEQISMSPGGIFTQNSTSIDTKHLKFKKRIEDVSAEVKEHVVPEIVNVCTESATGSSKMINVCVKSETESSPLILTLSEISERNLSLHTDTSRNGQSSSSSTSSLLAPETMEQMEMSMSPGVISTQDSTSLDTKDLELKTRKRRFPQHFGEIRTSDMDNPKLARHGWDIAKKKVLDQSKKIRNLQQTVRRLKSKVYSLNSLLKFLKQKYGQSDDDETTISNSVSETGEYILS